MDNLEKFLEIEKLNYLPIYYFINSEGKKKLMYGEKNNMTLEQIEAQKLKPFFKSNYYSEPIKDTEPTQYKKIYLTKEELKTRTLAYSIFIKYTDNLYCIDIDMEEIESLNDFINHLNEKISNIKTDYDESQEIATENINIKKYFNQFINIIKNCVWIKGNTKGIHIYIKISDVPNFTNQQNVYNLFKGDFLKKNNVWEKTTKCVNNYFGNPINIIPYEEIKGIFNNNFTSNKITSEKDKKKEPKKKIEYDDSISISDKEDEDEDHLKQILNGLSESRYENYSEWISIYCVFINEKLNMKLFDEFSQKSKKYNKYENNKLLKNVKKCDGLKMATLYYYLKQDNIELFNKLQKTRKDFWKMLYNMNQNDLSKLYYSLVPNKYILSNITGWYEYNNYNVLIHRGDVPSSLLNNISNKLQDYIIEQRNFILPKEKEYDEKMKLIKKAYNNLGQSAYSEGIIKYLKSLYLIDGIDDLLDSKIELFAFDDYLYDIKKKCFRLINPNDYISITTKYKAPIKIIDGIITPIRSISRFEKINKFINSIFENELLEEYYKIITGLSLFTNKLQNLYLHVGGGGNGKGLLSTILRIALGAYFLSAENTFLTTIYKAGTPNNTLYNAKSRRYLLISEPDDGSNDCRFNIDFIKTMTGGDEISARAVYGKNNLKYIPQFSTNVQTNSIPKLGKLDNGILRRVQIIPYNLSFVDFPKSKNERQINYKISDEITQQDYINEFILMLIDKAQEYYLKDYSKDIKIPIDVSLETDKYINENNPLKDWIDINIEITENIKDRISTTELYKIFNEDESIDVRYNNKEMTKYMKYNGFEPVKKGGINYYIFCKLKKNKNPFL